MSNLRISLLTRMFADEPAEFSVLAQVLWLVEKLRWMVLKAMA